eukprot:gene13489-28595_t
MSKRAQSSIDLSRHILSDQEDTEDEALEKSKEKNKPTDGKVTEEPVEELKRKKARTAKKFTEDILIGRDGIQRIYEEFPKACKFRGRGFEASDLKRLANLYKEWAFQLFPNLAYEDLLKSAERLGSKGVVKHALDGLRDKERSRYMKDTYGIDLLSQNNPTSTSINTATSQETSTIEHISHGPPSAPSTATTNASVTPGSQRNLITPNSDQINTASRFTFDYKDTPSRSISTEHSISSMVPSVNTSSIPLLIQSNTQSNMQLLSTNTQLNNHLNTTSTSTPNTPSIHNYEDGFLLSTYDTNCLNALGSASSSAKRNKSNSDVNIENSIQIIPRESTPTNNDLMTINNMNNENIIIVEVEVEVEVSKMVEDSRTYEDNSTITSVNEQENDVTQHHKNNKNHVLEVELEEDEEEVEMDF